MKISLAGLNFKKQPINILGKKILFLVLALSIWYFLISPYITKFKTYTERTDNIKTDNAVLFAPKSGRGVLPVEAQVVLIAIDSFKFKDYRLYKSLGDPDPTDSKAAEIYQRINESAWPVQLDTNSRNLIGYTDDIDLVPGIHILLKHKNMSVGTH